MPFGPAHIAINDWELDKPSDQTGGELQTHFSVICNEFNNY